MALPSSGTIALSDIKTEFSGPNTLTSYRRGAGYVRNHGVNSSIPSSGTITIRNFLGASKNFVTTITPQQQTIISGSFPNLTNNTYYGYLGGVDLVLSGFNRGPFGSSTQTQYGTSVSSTASTTFFGLYRWGEGNRLIFELSGDYTSNPGIWTSITLGSTTYTRASVAVTPTYNSTYNYTLWYWTNVTSDMSSPSTLTITP